MLSFENIILIINAVSTKIAISIVLILGTTTPLIIFLYFAYYFLELYEVEKIFMH